MAIEDFQIMPLWVSTLLVQPLLDHAPHTARLGELADQGLDDTMFDAEDPAVRWLQANTIHGLRALLSVGGFSGAPQIAVRAQLDRQALGDYQSLCNRPGTDLTGLYVVRAPSGPPDLGMRDDARPGSISFYDPRVGMNMNAIRKDPYAINHYTVRFEAGLLLLWPSYVLYYVHPHLYTITRDNIMHCLVASTGEIVWRHRLTIRIVGIVHP